MRFVITGIAGFIGSHLGETLLAAGHDVVGVDAFTDYYDPRLKELNTVAFEVIRRDLAEDSIEDLLSAADGVFHLAGRPGIRSFGDVFPEYVHDNILASHRLFESASTLGTRVVFASSSSVYGDSETYPTPEAASPSPRSPYGITKLACEHLASAYRANFNLDVITLRYFSVYGPRQRPDMSFTRIARALATDSPFEVYGDGSQSRSFTYVADVVEATIAAMERGHTGAVYNVGGGSEVALKDAISRLEALAGRNLDVRFRPSAAGDMKRTAADPRRIEQELGWRPRVSLDEGLRRQWEWMFAVERGGALNRSQRRSL
jgi:UDP-glucuronate 4-epimerase